jgi:PTH2 family peptidyl-tRNA hydrolase
VLCCCCSNPAQLAPWLEQGQAKVVVRVDSLEEMQTVATNARAAGIPTYIVRDAGRTQVEPGSQTVLAVGPAPVALLDTVTKHLKLL